MLIISLRLLSPQSFVFTFLLSFSLLLNGMNPHSSEPKTSGSMRSFLSTTYSELPSKEELAQELLAKIPGVKFKKPTTQLSLEDVYQATAEPTLSELKMLYKTLKLNNPDNVTEDDKRCAIPSFVIFGGTMGTGKSSIPAVFAQQLGWNYCFVRTPNIQTEFLGSGETNINTLFHALRSLNTPTIVVFDEVDSVFSASEPTSIAQQENDKCSMELLMQLNENKKQSMNNIILTVGTTTTPDRLHPLLRNHTEISIIQFTYPNSAQLEALLTKYCSQGNIAIDQKTIPWYVKRMHNWNIRNIQLFVTISKELMLSQQRQRNDVGKLIIPSAILQQAFSEADQTAIR